MLANVSRIEFSDTAQELHTALVSGRANNWFLLDNAPGCTRAKVAASCLLEPEIGDTVLVSVSACGGISYILAILAKPEHRGGSLRLPGGAAIACEQGALHLDAASIQLAATTRVGIAAPELELSALEGRFRFHHLAQWLNTLETQADAVRLVARSFHSTLERLVQKTRDSFRWTERLDESRAGRMRQSVKGRYHLNAEAASILAKKQVKIDGDKIDLG